jgi:hypothetical protein
MLSAGQSSGTAFTTPKQNRMKFIMCLLLTTLPITSSFFVPSPSFVFGVSVSFTRFLFGVYRSLNFCRRPPERCISSGFKQGTPLQS